MKIRVIVAKASDVETPWLVDAWDEWTEEEVPEIAERQMAKAREKLGTVELRIAEVEVSGGFLDAVFTPHCEAAAAPKREGA